MNEDALAINDTVLQLLPGESRTYLSIDTVESDTDAEAAAYPLEFLNSLIFSGMPPHKLSLKVGAVVVLLRNLSLQDGLCNGPLN